ncbi:hypothetical protein ACFC58_07040 [Kitasatospora purpeofusca]|uniref:hypothetical protein n=1 Tax=Kitasatospora purpeofusca TaxID=67352 RepID=UPI0035D8E17B
MDDDGLEPGSGGHRVAPYPTTYLFPTRDEASSYVVVSVGLFKVLPRYRISEVARALFLHSITLVADAADPARDRLFGQGRVRLDPPALAEILGAESEEVETALEELADRSLLLPCGEQPGVWQLNPAAVFYGPGTAQRETLGRVVEQRGGEYPVLPEPGAVLVKAGTGDTFIA